MGLSRASPAASPEPSCLFPAEGLIMAFHCLPVPAIISWFLAKQWFTQCIKVSFHFFFRFPTFWCFPAISVPEDILPFFFPFNLLLHSIYHHLSTPPLPFMLLELSCAAEFRGCSSLHLILLLLKIFHIHHGVLSFTYSPLYGKDIAAEDILLMHGLSCAEHKEQLSFARSLLWGLMPSHEGWSWWS